MQAIRSTAMRSARAAPRTPAPSPMMRSAVIQRRFATKVEETAAKVCAGLLECSDCTADAVCPILSIFHPLHFRPPGQRSRRVAQPSPPQAKLRRSLDGMCRQLCALYSVLVLTLLLLLSIFVPFHLSSFARPPTISDLLHHLARLYGFWTTLILETLLQSYLVP